MARKIVFLIILLILLLIPSATHLDDVGYSVGIVKLIVDIVRQIAAEKSLEAPAKRSSIAIFGKSFEK